MAIIKASKIASVIKDVEKLQPFTLGRDVKWCKLLCKTLWWFIKKLKIELLHCTAIPLLGIYSKELKSET